VRQDGFLVEESADSFLTAQPDALGLCRRLGFESEVIPTNPDHRRALVVSRGRLRPIPEGLQIMAPTRLWPMVTTPILSPWGKVRMGLERFIPRGGDRDESLASFARRRFGGEAYERLIQPLVGGMYTGDPDRLSVRATMPRFQEMEQAHGSLIQAALRESSRNRKPAPMGADSGARYGLFAGLRGGMASLIDALIGSLPQGSILCGCMVQRLQRSDGCWLIQGSAGERPTTVEADAVIIALPVRAAGILLDEVDPELGSRLRRISSTSCAVVSLAYRRDRIAHSLDGFGFVVPRRENRQILSGSFSSIKFPDRAPADMVLLRAFLGGAFQPELLERSDDELIGIAAREFADLLGIESASAPVLRHISRWSEVMPQYEIGHLELVKSIEARLASHSGLALAGNAYHGVGVPQCIRSGELAADQVADQLGVKFDDCGQ
jgi:oxygen-dependent protoporphyrinogen oxidase